MFRYFGRILSQWLYPPLSKEFLYFRPVVGRKWPSRQEVTFYAATRLSCSLKMGYYMIEYRATLPVDSTLSLCFGESTIALPASEGKIKKRIVFIFEKISFIYFRLDNLSDSSHSVDVPVSYMRIVPLRNLFAVNHMLRRIGSSRTQVYEQSKKRQIRFIDHLYNIYTNTFVQDWSDLYQHWQANVELELLQKEQLVINQYIIKEEFFYFRAVGYEPLNNSAYLIMQQALLNNPDVILIYADEDCLHSSGQRKQPWFKPSWNADLFLAQDYVSSCYLCRSDWYKRHHDVFSELGEQLALSRLLPELPIGKIMHLPLILTHRAVGKLTAEIVISKTSIFSEREQALNVLLPKDSWIEPGILFGTFRINYPLPSPTPKVSLLIPTRDALKVLKLCIESLLSKTDYPSYEVIILDNQSKDFETLLWFDDIVKDEKIRVLQYNHPFNYSAINNFGIKHAKGSIIGLINNDVEVISPGWLAEMVSHAIRPEIGCVGAKLYYSNGKIQHAGVILSEHNIAMHGHKYFDGDADGYHGRLKLVQNYSAVTGACLVVRKEIYEQVGGLNEEHLAIAYNDVDFCLKVREAGYRNLWTPYAELYHHESISRGSDDMPEKQKRLKKEAAYMRKKWGKELASDPCYNPNLTPLKEDFSLRVI